MNEENDKANKAAPVFFFYEMQYEKQSWCGAGGGVQCGLIPQLLMHGMQTCAVEWTKLQNKHILTLGVNQLSYGGNMKQSAVLFPFLSTNYTYISV